MFESIFGMEAIDYQSNSALGKALVKVFQDTMDYRDHLDYSRCAESEEARTAYRIDAVIKYCTTKMKPAFIKAVKDTTNLTVKQLHLFGGQMNGICGYFAINIGVSEFYEGITEAVGRSTGSTGYVTNDREQADAVTDLANAIDLHNAKLTKNTFGKKKTPIYINEIYFDVNMAFLAGDFVSEKYVKPLTSEELAAIMMHEIGHALTIIEHTNDIAANFDRFKNYNKNLKAASAKDPKVVTDYLKKLRDEVIPAAMNMLNCSDAQTPALSALRSLLINVASAVELLSKYSYKGSSASGTEGDYTFKDKVFGTMAFISNQFCFLCTFLSTLLVDIVFMISLSFIWLYMYKYSHYDRDDSNRKINDRRSNPNNLFTIERWADEFVSRSGYGEYLASGLNKFHTMIEYATAAPVASKYLNDTAWYLQLVGLQSWILDKVNVLAYLDPIIYEDSYNRVYRILQNTRGVFREANLPSAMVDSWLLKLDNIEAQVKKAKTMSDSDVGKSLLRLLECLTNPARVIHLIKDGALATDIAKLEDNIDDLSNNNLYSLSYRFR